jgi:hypothetical protein
MKSMPILNRSLPRSFVAALSFALFAQWGAPRARADVEIARSWATTAPAINGIVSPGEWTAATATTLASGGVNYAQMRTMNDGSYLYVLLDVYHETANDPIHQSGTPGDYYDLYIDKDLNYAVTPNVDFVYSTCEDGLPFVKAVMLSQTSSTGCQPASTNSLGARGFGTSFNSTANHRIYEFRLSLSELGVNTSTWTTSGGSVPKVRMDVVVSAANPSFTIAQPDPSTSPNFSLMYQVDLATSPSFPSGSTGPIFAGVGLVPFNYIDGSGHANIDIAGYYYATNAPFGGSLNVFGNWSTLSSSYGAARYRVVCSKNGGALTPLKQTWTNFELIGGTWVPTAVGPDSNNSYPIPPSSQTWYLPNLLISWQTASGFGDGTYTLELQLLNASGTQLASPHGNSLTLFVDNTPPTVAITNALYDGTSICECGIVTAGPCITGKFPFFQYHGLTLDLTVNDVNGALNGYSLDYTYGNNNSGNIFSDTYAPNHANANGPEQWDGVNNESEPSEPFCAPASCAYTFVLSASSRAQNGYGLVFPYVSYSKSLTILLSTNTGSINCP